MMHDKVHFSQRRNGKQYYCERIIRCLIFNYYAVQWTLFILQSDVLVHKCDRLDFEGINSIFGTVTTVAVHTSINAHEKSATSFHIPERLSIINSARECCIISWYTIPPFQELIGTILFIKIM